jgi:hypothetical protein
VVNPKFFPLLEQEGFRSATTCEHALATRHGHRYMIPRWLDKQRYTESHYRGWLLGLRPLVHSSPGVLSVRYWVSPRRMHAPAPVHVPAPQKTYRG